MRALSVSMLALMARRVNCVRVLPNVATYFSISKPLGTWKPRTGTSAQTVASERPGEPRLPSETEKEELPYKNPEYYGNNGHTYYDYEIVMEKKRLPQPDSGMSPRYEF